jgi:hypothetical protein
MPKKLKYPYVECARHGDPLPGFGICEHVLAGAPVAVRQEPSSTQLGVIACTVCKEDHELFGQTAQLSCAHCATEMFGAAPGKPVIFQNPARRKRYVMFTYETTTPESVEEGDFADTGIWYRGWRFKADDPGPMENLATPVSGVDDAVRTIQHTLGAIEPYNYPHFQPRTWYTESDSDIDYRTGEEMRKSAHLYGFTPREEYWVWQKLMERGRR